ncbi:MAG: T9SS type A sorting domain-containing protein, partial [Candidatus Kapaibacteriota bacterium]
TALQVHLEKLVLLGKAVPQVSTGTWTEAGQTLTIPTVQPPVTNATTEIRLWLRFTPNALGTVRSVIQHTTQTGDPRTDARDSITAIGVGREPGNIVTFRNDRMYVNGNPFFPMGWYSADPTAPGNVVLPYYHEVVGRYFPGTVRSFYSSDSIITSFRRYLDDAGKLVIFEVPAAIDNRSMLPDSVWQNVVRDSIIRTHRNFLGWYNADEPELIGYKDPDNNLRTFDRYYTSFVGQSRVQNYPYFKRRYDFIKQNDPNHAVFVTIVQPDLFREYLQQIPLPVRIPTQTWPTDLPANWRWTTYTGKFYDVLALDFYPFNEANPNPPSPFAFSVGFSIGGLRQNYLRVTPTANEGTTIYVAQGAGREEGHRNFDLRELAFTCIHALHTMQATENQDRALNLGGYLFWAYDPWSTRQTRDTVAAWMNFVNTNRIDSAAWGINRNAAIQSVSNISSLGESWHIFPFMREYNGDYYLFVVNTFSRFPIFAPQTANINTSLLLPWANATCEELLLRGGTRSIALTSGVNNTVSFSSAVRFDSAEVKVFRFRPSTGLIAFTPKASPTQSSLLNNSIHYSATLESSPSLRLEAAPNPANQKIVLNITSLDDKEGTIRFYSAEGREVFTTGTKSWKRGEQRFEITTAQWTSGTYWCVFNSGALQKAIQIQIIH